jgi:Predicted membrane protein
MKEKSYRSIVKSISWRTVGTIDTIVISYIITGKPTIALSIGGVEVFTKMTLYFFHERLWNRISFGKEKPSEVDYQI